MTSYHGYDPELYSLGLRYTLSKDFLDSHFALLLDMYKYLRVQMLFIQKYDNILKFLLWNASSSLSGFITWLKNNLRDFALQQMCMITLKNCTRYSKWLLNGEMMSTFPTLNLPKSVLLLLLSENENVSMKLSWIFSLSSIPIALFSQVHVCVF